jgi:hypothetical protein
VRIFGGRGFAFVTYAARANAEFAYQVTKHSKPAKHSRMMYSCSAVRAVLLVQLQLYCTAAVAAL